MVLICSTNVMMIVIRFFLKISKNKEIKIIPLHTMNCLYKKIFQHHDSWIFNCGSLPPIKKNIMIHKKWVVGEVAFVSSRINLGNVSKIVWILDFDMIFENVQSRNKYRYCLKKLLNRNFGFNYSLVLSDFPKKATAMLFGHSTQKLVIMYKWKWIIYLKWLVGKK